MIKELGELVKVLIDNNISLDLLFIEKIGNWDYNAKSFYVMDIDDMDAIEMIMEIEKLCDCSISDELCDKMGIMGSYDKPGLINPNDIIASVKSGIRLKKLEELGIK